jgi:hypothetical protein
MDRPIDPTPPGMGPVKPKSYVTSARELIANHKKSCIMVCGAIVILVIVLVVWASNAPDGFVAKYVPAVGMATWSSPDMKLLKKNHTGDTRRSDNKIDGWSKEDYMASVDEFNKIAARV